MKLEVWDKTYNGQEMELLNTFEFPNTVSGLESLKTWQKVFEYTKVVK